MRRRRETSGDLYCGSESRASLSPATDRDGNADKHYSVQHIHWFTLSDGLIIEHRANRDDVGMMVQLGLLPAPLPFGTSPPNV